MHRKCPNLVVVGVLCGAHGVRGRVRVKSFTTQPAALFDYAPFFDEQGQELLSPKTFESARGCFLVSPVQQRSKEEWDTLKGTQLHVQRICLPDTDDDEYYIEDLIGLQVVDEQSGSIGHVHAVFDHGAGDLLEIETRTDGTRVLVPFTHEDVPVIDRREGRITVARFHLWHDHDSHSGFSREK